MDTKEPVKEGLAGLVVAGALIMAGSNLIDILKKDDDGKSFHDKTSKNITALRKAKRQAVTLEERKALYAEINKHIKDVETNGEKLIKGAHNFTLAGKSSRRQAIKEYTHILYALKKEVYTSIQKTGPKEVNLIAEAYVSLRENYTPITVIGFLNLVKSQPLKTVLEGAKHVFTEPTRGASFILDVLKSSEIETSDFITLQESMTEYLNRAVEGGYNNQAHIDVLNESLTLMKNELNRRDSIEYIKEETIYNIHRDALKQSALMEGSEDISNTLDHVVFNMGDTPAAAVTYAISLDNSTIEDILQSDPGVALVKHTSMIIAIKDGSPLGLEYVDKLVGVPLMMAQSLFESDCKIATAENLKAIVKKQIERVTIALEQGYGDSGILEKYDARLHEAFDMFAQIINRKYTVIQESANELIEPYSEGLIDDGLDFTEEELALDEMFEPITEDEIKAEETYVHTHVEESFDPIDELFDTALLEQQFAEEFVKTFMDDSDNINLESFNKMMQIAYRYDIALEGLSGPEQTVVTEANAVQTGVRRVGNRTERAARGLTHSVKKIQSASKRATAPFKRAPKHVDNLIDKTVGSLIKMDRDERRKRIVEGGYKPRLFKLIRNGILTGAAWAVNPAIAAIGLIVGVANDKRLDRRVRHKLVDEMEAELRILNEKIEDAKSANERQKKYQLMRMRDKLERDTHRIRYNLKDMEG